MESLETSVKIEIIRMEEENARFTEDEVVVEHPFCLYVNERVFCEFACSPQNLKELITGLLLVKGQISSIEDIIDYGIAKDLSVAKVIIKENKQEVTNQIESSQEKICASTIYEIMEQNLSSSDLFHKTGGVHSVAIFNQKQKIVIMEDVARHNAVDKAIGYALMQHTDLSSVMLVVSGRISNDMLEKARGAGIPVVVSKSAPTDMAIRQANDKGITLVGFVRGSRMNIYTHPTRIELDDAVYKEIAVCRRQESVRKNQLLFRK